MRLFALALLVPAVAACSGHDEKYPETFNCAQETSDDDFAIGISKPGENGLLSFKLVDFAPSPPARMLNAWTVEIATMSAVAPVENATLDVFPFMPAHGHGAGVEVEVTSMPTAGQYQLDDINLHMPGVWEVTITAESSAGTDLAVFRPCIPN